MLMPSRAMPSRAVSPVTEAAAVPWWRRAGRPVIIAMFVLTLLFLYSIASGYRLRARVRAKLDSEHVRLQRRTQLRFHPSPFHPTGRLVRSGFIARPYLLCV